MIDFKINLLKNMKALKNMNTLKYLVIIAVLLGIFYMYYFYNVKEGYTQEEQCVMPPDIINSAMYDNVNNVHFYESKTPLSGNCYWPVELSGGVMLENKKEFKYCPLNCPENGENAKCTNSSMECGKSVIGSFFDNVTASLKLKNGSDFSDTLKNNWVIRVRNNISNNIQKTLTNTCELSYNACELACKQGDVSCRNVCEDIKNTCEYKSLPGFIPSLAENTNMSPSKSVNQYNSESIYYQKNASGNTMNSQNPFNNTYTGTNDSLLKYGLGGGLESVQGGVNPITGKIISPEDFNSQSNILSAHHDSDSPFGVFRQYLKNLVKEVNDDSSVGIGRVPNNSNPFLCDYIKSSASPASQSYIQSNPANQTYNGYTAGIAPFF